MKHALLVAVVTTMLATDAAAQQPTVTVLHSFNGLDGATPSGLIRVGPAELWGVTQSGGLWGYGSIFRMTRDGTFTSVYSFLGLGDGASPLGLVLGPDGAVYGTTQHVVRYANTPIWGTLFRIAPSGALTTLFVFRESSIGYEPGPLMVTRDGAMFGMTSTGGPAGYGAVFQTNTNGALTVAHAFTADDTPSYLRDPIVESTDGALWGTTNGTLGITFKLTRAGTYTPFGFAMHGLLAAADGSLYGSFHHEGIPSYGDYMAHISATGAAIRVGPYWSHIYVSFSTQLWDGSLIATAENKILHVAADFSFRIIGVAPSNIITLVDGHDGFLYGTSGGGVLGRGTVFRASPTGSIRGIPNDFDGQVGADPAVFRPLDGSFWILESGRAVQSFFLVAPDAVPVPADYDGDGRTDAALFYPALGEWRIITSAFNGVGGVLNPKLGGPGDVPVPADYDGDGLADIAVYQPSTGHWHNANPAFDAQWGIPGDIPIPADYDGDGKTDVAIYRPSTSTWWILPSSTHVPVTYVWGAAGDVPVPADYDGDGKADIAMYRPSTGQWWIRTSSSHFTANVAQWGNVGDTPVPADFDGDGKADLAVFTPSGYWFVLKSSTNYTTWDTIAWGQAGDIPLAPLPHQNVP